MWRSLVHNKRDTKRQIHLNLIFLHWGAWNCIDSLNENITCHPSFTFKLRAFEFPTKFENWIESYLTNRTCVVRFRKCESRPFVASSGVPQGSHLGPLLFVLAINDIAYFLKHSNLLIYADDMKLYWIIHEKKYCTLLQEDLNSFASWCSNNSLILNANKCQKVSFSWRNQL